MARFLSIISFLSLNVICALCSSCVQIHDIQGDSFESPIKGDTVSICEVVVTAIYSTRSTLSDPNGFFIQTIPGNEDNDDDTSEGVPLFFNNDAGTKPEVGDHIEVINAVVGDYFGQTNVTIDDFTQVQIRSSGNPLPSPVDIDLPPSGSWDFEFERVEGMIVRVRPSTDYKLRVSEFFQLERFAEILVCALPDHQERVYQFTQQYRPSICGYEAFTENNEETCYMIDDGRGSNSRIPSVGGYTEINPDSDDPLALETLRLGSLMVEHTGIVAQAFGYYRVHPYPNGGITFDQSVNPRPPISDPITTSDSHNLKIVSANVLNYFITLGTQDTGPNGDKDARGASNQNEFDRQEAKLLTALRLMDADIYGVMEVENAKNTSTRLADQLNLVTTGRDYKAASRVAGLPFVDEEDVISVDIIYDDAKLDLKGDVAVLRTANFTGDKTNRAPMAATFTLTAEAEDITVVAVHMKSKGQPSSDPTPPPENLDINDGKGNWNDRRLSGVRDLVEWIDSNPTTVNTDNIVVLGDFNAYAREDPMEYMLNNPTRSYYITKDIFADPPPYSFLFDGAVGTLDYMLTSNELRPYIRQVVTWAINSDEPPYIDYNLGSKRNETVFDPDTPYRFSDHDPVIMALDLGGTPGPVASFASPRDCHYVHEIQGSGFVSPIYSSLVNVCEVVVTGLFGSSSFWVQTKPGEEDANSATSEGLLVFYDASSGSLPNPGDYITLEQVKVEEYFGQTQVVVQEACQLQVVSSGNPMPSPVQVTIPPASGTLDSTLEAVEGMIVSIVPASNHQIRVSEFFNLDRFGEIRVCSIPNSQQRLYQYTQINTPSVSGYTSFISDRDNRCITIDDGRTDQNPDPLLVGGYLDFNPPSSSPTALETLRLGSLVTSSIGVIGYSFSAYRVHPCQGGELVFDQSVNPRPAATNPVTTPSSDYNLVIVSTNVLNYFTTIDQGGAQTGPNSDQDPRGADSNSEFTRQKEKLLTAMTTLAADIYGVMEVENANQATKELADSLTAATTGRDYKAASVTASLSSVDASDAISCDIIYDANRLSLDSSNVAVLTDQLAGEVGFTTPLFDGSSTNRAPIAATFTLKENGVPITIVVNHFKSKGGEGSGLDADQGDGAGNYNNIRLRGVQALVAWLDNNPTGIQTKNAVVMGDFNAYAREDPMEYIFDNPIQSYVSAKDLFADPPPYSFLFDGLVGTLDYMLTSPSLAPSVKETITWAVNCDEPDAIDYNEDFGRPSTWFDGSIPYRFSDHDPVFLILQLEEEAPSDTNVPLLVGMVFVMLAGVTMIGFAGIQARREEKMREAIDTKGIYDNNHENPVYTPESMNHNI